MDGFHKSWKKLSSVDGVREPEMTIIFKIILAFFFFLLF